VLTLRECYTAWVKALHTLTEGFEEIGLSLKATGPHLNAQVGRHSRPMQAQNTARKRASNR
jgi:hypothetical protein